MKYFLEKKRKKRSGSVPGNRRRRLEQHKWGESEF